MASLLKRKTDAAAHNPPWHPNFRNETKLPDVKVIRTSFFVNAGIAVLFGASLLWVAYQEYSRAELKAQIAQATAQIEQDAQANRKAVALYKEFQVEEKKVTELEAFMGSRSSMKDFVLTMASIIPQEIALSSMEVGDEQTLLRGYVSGIPAKASGEASAFERALREHAEIGKAYSQITLTTIGRDNASGRMSFTITMKRAKADPKAKPDAKKAKK